MKTLATQPTTTKQSIIVDATPTDVWMRLSNSNSMIRWMNPQQQYELESIVLNWKSGGLFNLQLNPKNPLETPHGIHLAGKIRTIVDFKSLVFSLNVGIVLSFQLKSLPGNRTRVEQTVRCRQFQLTSFEETYFNYLLENLKSTRRN